MIPELATNFTHDYHSMENGGPNCSMRELFLSNMTKKMKFLRILRNFSLVFRVRLLYFTFYPISVIPVLQKNQDQEQI